MCELIHCIFNMRWFRKIATVIMFDEIRSDAGDLVSEELRKSYTVCPEKCNQAVVWISRGEEFYLWRGLAELLESKLV